MGTGTWAAHGVRVGRAPSPEQTFLLTPYCTGKRPSEPAPETPLAAATQELGGSELGYVSHRDSPQPMIRRQE